VTLQEQAAYDTKQAALEVISKGLRTYQQQVADKAHDDQSAVLTGLTEG